MGSSRRASWSPAISWSGSSRKKSKGTTMEAGTCSTASPEARKTWMCGRKWWRSGWTSNRCFTSNALSRSWRRGCWSGGRQVGDLTTMKNRLWRGCRFSIIRPSQWSISTRSRARWKKSTLTVQSLRSLRMWRLIWLGWAFSPTVDRKKVITLYRLHPLLIISQHNL